MISFKGAQYPKDVILFAAFLYVRYGVSYRDLAEIMHERGVTVDHTTLNRVVTRFSGAIAEAARRRKGACDRRNHTMYSDNKPCPSGEVDYCCGAVCSA